VVATLRDYLTCEHKVKNPTAPVRQYTKDNMSGCLVKIPQQQNFTDCGLFLLQYVEHFFADPIKDYRIPIKSLTNWFHPDIATKKREDIAILIKKLRQREGFEDSDVPDILFPTKDGVVLQQQHVLDQRLIVKSTDIAEDSFEDPNYVPAGEEINDSSQSTEGTPTVSKRVYVAKKRSFDKTDNGNGEHSSAKISKK
jgi:sentrin-specific protease 7